MSLCFFRVFCRVFCCVYRVSTSSASSPASPEADFNYSDPSLTLGSFNGGGHGSKLGPKANTGAINDKLRALDRSGKPCKRWAKAGFTLKSFTGVQWAVPAWSAPRTFTLDTPTNTGTNSENASVTDISPPDDKMQPDPPASSAAVIPTLSLPLGISV